VSYFSCKVTRVKGLDEKSKRGYMIEITQIIIGMSILLTGYMIILEYKIK
jgi:hypothetical protein